MGSKLSTIFPRAGHDVIFSYSRTRQKLQHLAKDPGAHAHVGTPADATRDADAVLLAVHWTRVDDVLAQAGTLAGTVLLTRSLPMSKDDMHIVIGHPLPVRKPWRLRSQKRMWYRIQYRPQRGALSGV
jgi:predicted dinucleotide-binding enzyme